MPNYNYDDMYGPDRAYKVTNTGQTIPGTYLAPNAPAPHPPLGGAAAPFDPSVTTPGAAPASAYVGQRGSAMNTPTVGGSGGFGFVNIGQYLAANPNNSSLPNAGVPQMGGRFGASAAPSFNTATGAYNPDGGYTPGQAAIDGAINGAYGMTGSHTPSGGPGTTTGGSGTPGPGGPGSGGEGAGTGNGSGGGGYPSGGSGGGGNGPGGGGGPADGGGPNFGRGTSRTLMAGGTPIIQKNMGGGGGGFNAIRSALGPRFV